MDSLILEEGLNDFIFIESEENINLLNQYADQLISETIDPSLEEKIIPLLNKYCNEYYNIFEDIVDFPDDTQSKPKKPKKVKPLTLRQKSDQKVKEVKEKKKEQEKKRTEEEIAKLKKLAKSNSPVDIIKRKLGGKTLGEIIKRKLLSTKKIKELKSKLQKGVIAAALRAKEQSKIAKEKFKEYSKVPEYQRMQDGAAMKLRKEAITATANANNLRKGIRQRSMLWLKRKL